jgi:hypothetical protein
LGTTGIGNNYFGKKGSYVNGIMNFCYGIVAPEVFDVIFWQKANIVSWIDTVLRYWTKKISSTGSYATFFEIFVKKHLTNNIKVYNII